VIGVDFTAEQLAKPETLAEAAGFGQAVFRAGRIERLPVESASADCVISNGVINLYEFITERARNASVKYGVKSVSLLARKES